MAHIGRSILVAAAAAAILLLSGAGGDWGSRPARAGTAATQATASPAQTGARGIGFWRGRNGQSIVSAGAGTGGTCGSATWLRRYAPFRDLSGTAHCSQVAGYVSTVIGAADARGAAMNAALKAQMLATALDVFFSDPTLGGNRLRSPVPIGTVAIDLTAVCTGGCGAYEDVSSAFGSTALGVDGMLSAAAARSNDGGSKWYGNVKTTQELAKDAFEAVNSELALPADTSLSSIVATAAPDVTRRVSKTIGPFGGSLEAEGADGTRYRLVVPAGALGADTEISLAPAVVSGLDPVADQVTAGVDFAPDGLQFAIPAHLTITLSAAAGNAFAATFRSGAPGISFLLDRVAGDVVSVPIAHFSDLATLHVRIDQLNKAISSALANAPQLDSPQLEQLVTAYARSGSGIAERDALATFLMNLYTTTVAPAIPGADNSLVDWELAGNLVGEFGSIVQRVSSTGTGSDLPSGDATRPTLGLVVQSGIDAVIGKGETLLSLYSASGAAGACSGAVLGVTDWVAIPNRLSADLNVLGATTGYAECLTPHVETLVPFPTTIDSTVQNVTTTIQGTLLAPAQTPGGLPSPSGKLFPEPTVFDLDAQGALFSGGSDTLNTVTGANGTATINLDRGADASARAPRVTISGTATITDLGLVLVVNNGSNVAPVDETTGPPIETRVAFQSPPVDAVLQPGGTTNLCVLVSDAESKAIVGLPVDWELNGSGSLASSSTTTAADGTACVDYHHPAGPVADGDTAEITATATHDGVKGSDTTTLNPFWVAIEIEARTDPTSGFANVTNGTLPVTPGQTVDLRLTLTAAGAKTTDPPQPLAETSVVGVDIESGGGVLIGAGGTGSTSIIPLVDANGQIEVAWDPGTSTTDTTVRVSYPGGFLFGSDGVTATVDFVFNRLAVSPAATTIETGSGASFTASGPSAAGGVTWSATGGSIDASGHYTAPATAGTYTVTATSVTNPGDSGTATVHVVAPPTWVTHNSTYSGTYTLCVGPNCSQFDSAAQVGHNPFYGTAMQIYCGTDISQRLSFFGTIANNVFTSGPGTTGGCIWTVDLASAHLTATFSGPSGGDYLDTPCYVNLTATFSAQGSDGKMHDSHEIFSGRLPPPLPPAVDPC